MTHQDDQPTAPQTGIAEVDAALTELDDIAERPVSDHHDRLSRVHEALHTALHRQSEDQPVEVERPAPPDHP